MNIGSHLNITFLGMNTVIAIQFNANECSVVIHSI